MKMIKEFNLIACCDNLNGIGSNGDLPWSLPKEYQYFQFVTQRIEDNLSFLDQYKDDLPEKSDLNNNKLIEKNTRQASLFKKEDEISLSNQNELCNCIIMGRLTWQSLPEFYRPLKNRLNLVISKNENAIDLNINKDHLFRSLEDALQYASKLDFIKQIFIVGGQEIYRNAIRMKKCNKIYLTKIDSQFNCDRFFPSINEQSFEEIDEFDLKDREQFENNLNYKFRIYKRRISEF